MNTKKIYLTRHGQTDFNLQGIVQGSGVDSDLNATGRAQAQAFYARYKDTHFDKLYVSALKRTHQSVQQFIDGGLSYEALPELNEISWGIREGVPVDKEGHAHYWDMVKRWREGEVHLRIEGGESPEDVAERLKRGMDHIMSKTEEEQILICMHGRSMRVLLTVLLNYPLSSMDLFQHHNLGLYELTFTGNQYVVDRYNDTSHLDFLNV